ncbi:MAG: inorganic diphosphatase [Mariniphaga sp.]|nr:inorganic diphosphatase [Mariniphaga sp.]
MVFVLFLLYACNNSGMEENTVNNTTNLLHEIVPFTTDSLVHVVIEIPAGTNQKWEVNKVTGQIEWEQITPDSFRVINYLPYPANYGFVPQTLLPEVSGGDGDPVDVFVLGEHIERGHIVKCKIIGGIEMMDNGETDDKLIALPVQSHWEKINTLENLNQNYPGVLEILNTWLLHYKRNNEVKILSLRNEAEAVNYLETAHFNYKKHQPAKLKAGQKKFSESESQRHTEIKIYTIIRLIRKLEDCFF